MKFYEQEKKKEKYGQKVSFIHQRKGIFHTSNKRVTDRLTQQNE